MLHISLEREGTRQAAHDSRNGVQSATAVQPRDVPRHLGHGPAPPFEFDPLRARS